MVKYIIEQKWSPTLRRFTKHWVVRNATTKRIVYQGNSYGNAVKWLRKKK